MRLVGNGPDPLGAHVPLSELGPHFSWQGCIDRETSVYIYLPFELASIFPCLTQIAAAAEKDDRRRDPSFAYGRVDAGSQIPPRIPRQEFGHHGMFFYESSSSSVVSGISTNIFRSCFVETLTIFFPSCKVPLHLGFTKKS